MSSFPWRGANGLEIAKRLWEGIYLLMAIQIGEQEMHDIARGATILGTGGGGDPYVGKLIAIAAIRKNGPVTLLDPSEVMDDWFVIPTAIMGAPTVLIERYPGEMKPWPPFACWRRPWPKRPTRPCR